MSHSDRCVGLRRVALLATVAAAALAASGCATQRNVVYERLYPQYRPAGERQTDVLAAAQADGETMTLIANGGNYFQFQAHYEHGNPVPARYERWHAFPMFEEPYLFEIFLAVTVRGFPPPGQRRDIPTDAVDLRYAEWRDRQRLSVFPVELDRAVAYWRNERTPVIEIIARSDTPPAPPDEQSQWDPNPFGGPGAPLVIERRKVWGMLVAELSAEAFTARLEAFRRAGATERLRLEE